MGHGQRRIEESMIITTKFYSIYCCVSKYATRRLIMSSVIARNRLMIININIKCSLYLMITILLFERLATNMISELKTILLSLNPVNQSIVKLPSRPFY